MKPYAERQCSPLPAGTAALSPTEIEARLGGFDGWCLEEGAITRTFAFADFHRTMAFVNAVAWIAHQQDHHPELRLTYNQCRVAYHTHSIGGVSENDFICAARIEALLG